MGRKLKQIRKIYNKSEKSLTNGIISVTNGSKSKTNKKNI